MVATSHVAIEHLSKASTTKKQLFIFKLLKLRQC